MKEIPLWYGIASSWLPLGIQRKVALLKKQTGTKKAGILPRHNSGSPLPDFYFRRKISLKPAEAWPK